jgi:CDP-diacylglycerol--glycerol-3-phosphate 3-phosphatidyltransferase
LARAWKVESGFGRIMDPFADKILVLGGFVFLASADFWWEFSDPRVVKLSGHGMQISGVYPWMVVTIMARELLVTSLRGYVESKGHAFPADRWGKLKMFLQSVAIPTSLIATAVTAVVPADPTTSWLQWPWGRQVIDVVVRAMVFVTVASAIPYIWRAVTILSARPTPTAAPTPYQAPAT